MIIGFLGKGGSGKSTLSHRFIGHLHAAQKRVHAIDADHNMDLAYNLGASSEPFIGNSMDDLRNHVGLTPADHYSALFNKTQSAQFSLSVPDCFTEKYSHHIGPGLTLMIAGPHTEDILQDAKCSHSLFTPLKLYLPYLSLEQDECVVVDGTAGTDFAGTGVVTGLDLAVVVFEPTVHSMKAAKQIAGILTFYKTPYVFAVNKMTAHLSREQIGVMFGFMPELFFEFNTQYAHPAFEDTSNASEFEKIIEHTKKNPTSRLKRSADKYKTKK